MVNRKLGMNVENADDKRYDDVECEVIARFEAPPTPAPHNALLEARLLELAETIGWPTCLCLDGRWVSGREQWRRLAGNAKDDALLNWIKYLEDW